MNFFYSLISPSRDAVRAQPAARNADVWRREEPVARAPSNEPASEKRSVEEKSAEDVGRADVIPRSPWDAIPVQPRKPGGNRYAVDKAAFLSMVHMDVAAVPNSARDNLYVKYWTGVFRKAEGGGDGEPQGSGDATDEKEFMELFDEAFKFKGMDEARDVAKVQSLQKNPKVRLWAAAFLAGDGDTKEGGASAGFWVPWSALLAMATASMTVMPRRP